MKNRNGILSRILSSRHTHRVWLVLLTLVAKGLLLDDPFILDDYSLLSKVSEPNAAFQDIVFDVYALAKPGQVSGWHGWWASSELKVNYFRPVAGILLWMEYRLWGRSALPYHIDSMILYLLCILLVHQLARTILGSWPGLMTGAVFAAAPMHVTNIQWIANRVDILSCLGVIMGLVLYRKGLIGSLKRRQATILVGISYLGAILAKENAVLFPVFLLLFHWFLRHTGSPLPSNQNPTRSDPRSDQGYLFTNVIICCIITMGWGLFYRSMDFGVAKGYLFISEMSMGQAIISMLKSLVLYIGNILFFLKPSEILKTRMYSDLLVRTLVVSGVGLIFFGFVVRMLRISGIILLILALISLAPSLPFWVSDRMGFFSVVWFALMMGALVRSFALRSGGRVFYRVIASGIVLWFVGAASATSFLLSLHRDVWNQTCQKRLLNETRRLLRDSPNAREIYYFSLPDPLLAMSLQDNLRWNLERDELVVYPLLFLPQPPRIMVRGAHGFRLWNPQAALLDIAAKKVFLFETGLRPGKQYATGHFQADVVGFDNIRGAEIEFTFPELTSSERYLFIVWGGNPPRAQRFSF